ncbi:MAG: DUF6898 family protein [Caulobacterales bacterium]|jgi:hypothetical protein
MSRRVYIEITVIGDVARIAAIDAETGVEAVAVGPASAARADLERLALAKLDHIQAKETGEGVRSVEPPVTAARRPGRIV